jgi:diguanylate cyclase (GGDEF)-like protein
MKTNLNAKKMTIAIQTLAVLRQQEATLRTELGSLEKKIAAAHKMLNGQFPGEVAEANAQLVVSALHSDAVAETAVNELEELARTSQNDGLTGTPNRALMRDRMEQAIATAHRRGTGTAVIFVDLDHFKEVNDTMGHTVGDEVLTMVARRLETAVRETDTVSRHGGDEFLVLLPEIAHPAHAAIIANKILASLDAPCQIGKNTLQVAVSLGIAFCPKDAHDADTLICLADAAMYQSKNAGGGRFAFYCKEESAKSSSQANALDGQLQSDAHLQYPIPEMETGGHDLRVCDRRKANNNDRRQRSALSARRLVR